MSAGTEIKTAAERLNAVAPAIRKRTIEEAKDAEIAELRAALEAAKIPPDRLQNWIDVIHDNERSMGDRLQSLSSIFGGLLRGDAVDKYPLQPIREQQPDSERDAALAAILSDGYEGGMMVDQDLGGKVILYYISPACAENAFVAITDVISVQQDKAQPLPGDKP